MGFTNEKVIKNIEKASDLPFNLPEMKEYSCCAKVKSQPMTREIYNLYRGREISIDEHPDDDGFLIQREDGSETWEPKETFEATHIEMAVSPQPSVAIDVNQDSMLQWFAYKHLPPHLQEASKAFYDLAHHVVTTTKPGRERSVCLRKLLEAKDAGVRAALNPGA